MHQTFIIKKIVRSFLTEKIGDEVDKTGIGELDFEAFVGLFPSSPVNIDDIINDIHLTTFYTVSYYDVTLTFLFVYFYFIGVLFIGL